MSGLLIRWRDPALWPGVLAHVPAHHRVVSDPVCAEQIGVSAFAELREPRRGQFTELWIAALHLGLQPSGLLLVNLPALAPVLGHTSSTVPKAMNRFCLHQQLWCRVPGKLYPHPRGDAPGQRSRSYLVIEPAAAEPDPRT
jgi:hypothetical protein